MRRGTVIPIPRQTRVRGQFCPVVRRCVARCVGRATARPDCGIFLRAGGELPDQGNNAAGRNSKRPANWSLGAHGPRSASPEAEYAARTHRGDDPGHAFRSDRVS
jgi:hypothetical protein